MKSGSLVSFSLLDSRSPQGVPCHFFATFEGWQGRRAALHDEH